MLHNETKTQIADAALHYCNEHKLSQADLVKSTGINSAYLSRILAKKFTVPAGGKNVEIQDKWFLKLANKIGYAVTKQYWPVVQTKEFETIISNINIAKKEGTTITLITETGLGKTFAVNRFLAVNPQHTYKITVNSEYKIKDILMDIAQQLGATISNHTIVTLRNIAHRLFEIKMQGNKPILIIDEAENLRLPVIQMLKGLYDIINGYAAIVLIGTSQLTESLIKMNRSNRRGAPQFYRRIQAGIKKIPSTADFRPFYQVHGITDRSFQQLLRTIADNYGVLHDYLEPVLRYADERKEPLTEALFRTYHNIPNR